MNNMQVEITSVEEQEKTAKIRYKTNMETNAGNVEFLYTAELLEDKEKGYLINWESNLIFPKLDDTDKVRIKNISAERGEIRDKNGVVDRRVVL